MIKNKQLELRKGNEIYIMSSKKFLVSEMKDILVLYALVLK